LNLLHHERVSFSINKKQTKKKKDKKNNNNNNNKDKKDNGGVPVRDQIGGQQFE